jgi:hypothetical protein
MEIRDASQANHSFFPIRLPNHRGHHDAGIACTKMPTTKPARPLPNTKHLSIALHGSCESSPDHGQIRPDCSIGSRVFNHHPQNLLAQSGSKLAARPQARVRGLPL